MKTTIAYLKKMGQHTGRRVLIVLFAIGLTLGASAQRGVHFSGGGGGWRGGGYHYYYPRTYVNVGFGLGYGYYSPFFPYYGFYSPFGWGYPYPAYYGGSGAYGTPPSLYYQIQDIKNDYSKQIADVKADKALTGKERRQRVRDLKNERDNAIDQAKRNFWYNNSYRRGNTNGPAPYKGNDNSQPQPNNQQPNNNNNNQPSNTPKSSSSNSSGEQPEYTQKGQ